MRRILSPALAALLLASAQVASAELSPLEIAKEAFDKNTFAATNARVSIELEVLKSGKLVRQRKIETSIKKVDTRTRAFVEFSAPSDVAGTKFLSIEEENGGTQQFIFLPAFKKVKRIVGAQRTQSFMGTDFSYADLEGRDVEKANWKRLADEKIKGEDCYVLESVPKTPADEVYGKMVVWIHKQNLIPLKSEFYDKGSAEIEKRMIVEKLAKKDDRWVAMDSYMETPRKDSRTRLKVLAIDFKSEIPDSAFKKEALER